jgi:hypothetical protein
MAGRAALAARLGYPIIIVAVWAAMAAAANPRGNFSLNDDWAYGLPVRALVEGGSIRFTFWQSMTLIAQVFWGALFCLPGGFSFDALRVSTLVAGLVGVLALYGLLRHYGASLGVATIGALTFAVNPLYLGMSCTFMTDVPFTALMILSIAQLALGLDTASERAILVGLAAAFTALFIRQLALAVLLGFLIASPLKIGLGRRWLLMAVLPSVTAGLSLFAYTRVLKASGRLPGMYFLKADSLNQVIHDLIQLRLGALKPALSAALMMLLLAGLFATPFLALVGRSLIARGSRAVRLTRLIWVIGFTIAATIALAASGNLMPLTGNVFADFKMGILAMPGDAPPGPPKVFWVGVTALASVGVSLLLLVLVDLLVAIVATRRDPREAILRCHVVFLVAAGVLYFAPLGLPYQAMLDRYVIPILALFLPLIVLVPGIKLKRPPRSALALSLLLIAVFTAYGVTTVHDYFAWNRIRWAACGDLMEGHLTGQKVASDDINGGFEFNNQIPNDRGIYTTSVNGTLIEDADRRRYAIAFRSLPGFEVLARRPCRVWLAYSPHEILVLRRTGPAQDGDSKRPRSFRSHT